MPASPQSMAWLPDLTPAARTSQHGSGTARHTAIGTSEAGTHTNRACWIRHFENCCC